MGSLMGGEGFFLDGFKGGKAIRKSCEESLSKWWVGPRFISKEEGKGGGFG